MIRAPPGFTRTATVLPVTALFRSDSGVLPLFQFRDLPCCTAFGWRPAEGWIALPSFVRRSSCTRPLPGSCLPGPGGKLLPWFRQQGLLDPASESETDRYNQFSAVADRSEEHTSELQSLIRNSYAVFCLNKKN